MPDRESVITHLQIIHTWAEFARERDLQFFTAKHLEDIAQWTDDAITLLKKQEQDRIEIAHEMVSNSILMYQGKEIVRCKDCKYYHKPEYGFTLGDCTYGNVWFQAKEDGFCSDAKRKDN